MLKNIFILLFGCLVLLAAPANAQVHHENKYVNVEPKNYVAPSIVLVSLNINVLSLDRDKYEKLMNEHNLPEIESYYYSSNKNIILKDSIQEYEKYIMSSIETTVKPYESFDFSFRTSLVGNISNEFSMNAEPTSLFDDKILFENLNVSSFNSLNIDEIEDVFPSNPEIEMKPAPYRYNYDVYMKSISFKKDKENIFIFRKKEDTYLVVSIKPSILFKN